MSADLGLKKFIEAFAIATEDLAASTRRLGKCDERANNAASSLFCLVQTQRSGAGGAAEPQTVAQTRPLYTVHYGDYDKFYMLPGKHLRADSGAVERRWASGTETALICTLDLDWASIAKK